MAFKKAEELKNFKVSNTDLVLGRSYQVTPKFDASAPDGFQRMGTTKLLSPNVRDTHGIYFDEDLNIWDTGFDEMSLSNSEIPDSEKTVLVNMYNEKIRKPYEKMFGKDLSSIDTQDSFWKTYKFEVYNGKVFDTSNPKDLLDLFMALKNYRICEKGDKHFMANNSMYNVINKEKLESKKNDRNAKKAEAIFTYMTLQKADPETLYNILEWLQFSNVRKTDSQVLLQSVMNFIENDIQNVENFLSTYEMSQTERGKEEMDMFSIVMSLYSKKEISYKRREYYLKEEPIGNSPKDIAKRALSNPTLMKSLIDLSEK